MISKSLEREAKQVWGEFVKVASRAYKDSGMITDEEETIHKVLRTGDEAQVRRFIQELRKQISDCRSD